MQEMQRQIAAKANEIFEELGLENVTGKMQNLKRAGLVYNHLARNIKYDLLASSMASPYGSDIPMGEMMVRKMYNTLINGRGACACASSTYSFLLKMLGISSRVVMVQDDNRIPHAINFVEFELNDETKNFAADLTEGMCNYTRNNYK